MERLGHLKRETQRYNHFLITVSHLNLPCSTAYRAGMTTSSVCASGEAFSTITCLQISFQPLDVLCTLADLGSLPESQSCTSTANSHSGYRHLLYDSGPRSKEETLRPPDFPDSQQLFLGNARATLEFTLPQPTASNSPVEFTQVTIRYRKV